MKEEVAQEPLLEFDTSIIGSSDAPESALPSDLLLVIFIHGFVDGRQSTRFETQVATCRFKGSDHTFAEFPQRLQHILSETILNAIVECVVFPAYEVCCVAHF